MIIFSLDRSCLKVYLRAVNRMCFVVFFLPFPFFYACSINVPIFYSQDSPHCLLLALANVSHCRTSFSIASRNYSIFSVFFLKGVSSAYAFLYEKCSQHCPEAAKSEVRGKSCFAILKKINWQ